MNQIPEKFEPASVISSEISPGTDQAEKIRLILEQIRPGLASRKAEVIPVEPSQAKVDPGAATHSSPATIIDLSLGELLQKYPQELIGVDIDQNQVELDFLLEKVGKTVGEFLRNLPNTASKEQIRQERLRADGKVASRIGSAIKAPGHNDFLLASRWRPEE
jgi:hypothetical protein